MHNSILDQEPGRYSGYKFGGLTRRNYATEIFQIEDGYGRKRKYTVKYEYYNEDGLDYLSKCIVEGREAEENFSISASDLKESVMNMIEMEEGKTIIRECQIIVI